MPRDPLTLEQCADMVNHNGADTPHIEDSIRSALEVLKEREENQVGDGRITIERCMFLPLRDDAEPMTEAHAPPI